MRRSPNTVYALDLNNDGYILWKYEPKQDASVVASSCAVTPSIAALPMPTARFSSHQADTTLVADRRQNGEPSGPSRTAIRRRARTGTSAPLVVKDKVIIGNSGGEFGVRGHLTAYDIATGKQLWRAYSVGPDAEIALRSGEDDEPRQTRRQGELADHLERRSMEDRRRRAPGAGSPTIRDLNPALSTAPVILRRDGTGAAR